VTDVTCGLKGPLLKGKGYRECPLFSLGMNNAGCWLERCNISKSKLSLSCLILCPLQSWILQPPSNLPQHFSKYSLTCLLLTSPHYCNPTHNSIPLSLTEKMDLQRDQNRLFRENSSSIGTGCCSLFSSSPNIADFTRLILCWTNTSAHCTMW
jgi:hypothetical protein